MKKAIMYLVGAIFFLSVVAFAADKPVADKANPIKTNPVRIAKMNASGKVIEISGETIKIERTIKSNVEMMEFALEKPTINIVVNDEVKIAYIEKDGRLLAVRVAKITPRTGEKSAVAETTLPKK